MPEEKTTQKVTRLEFLDKLSNAIGIGRDDVDQFLVNTVHKDVDKLIDYLKTASNDDMTYAKLMLIIVLVGLAKLDNVQRIDKLMMIIGHEAMIETTYLVMLINKLSGMSPEEIESTVKPGLLVEGFDPELYKMFVP